MLLFENSAVKTRFEEVVVAADTAAEVGGGSDDSQVSEGLQVAKGTTGTVEFTEGVNCSI